MKPLPDRNLEHAALGAIGVLFEPGDVIEIRALEFRRQPDHTGITYAGYFNFENQAAIQHAIRAVDGFAEGVYVVLNRFDPQLLARSANRLKARLKHTTSDADIIERRWLFIDADASRPSGISATDAEHQQALDRTLAIRDFLGTRGWPEAIHGDSGNGGHLLYRLPQLDIDRAGELVKQVLKALGTRFTDPAVKVDESTATAARICKLYGTLARKGDSVPNRPHRRSCIRETPERIDPVPLDRLEELAAEGPTQRSAVTVLAPRDTQFARSFDNECWLSNSGLAIRGPVPYQGGPEVVCEVPFQFAAHWHIHSNLRRR